MTEAGRSARTRGEGDELRELRDHVVGDPFKRIAWRASARKGRLVVREMERYERDVVWLVLDASVEGLAGLPGTAPLDRAVDEVASVAVRHLSRGDRVGLVIFASRARTWIAPAGGPAQAALLTTALAGCSTMVDADRCELDELEVAERVAEHLRPLSREPMAHLPLAANLDRLATLAESVRGRAPFEARMPYAPTERDRKLRHYLACFGIEVPPRSEGERARAESELARTLTKLSSEKPRPSIVAIWAPPPPLHGLVARGIRTLRSRRAEVRWTLFDAEPSLVASSTGAAAVASSMEEAVRMRIQAEQLRGRANLRALGIAGQSRLGGAMVSARAASEDPGDTLLSPPPKETP